MNNNELIQLSYSLMTDSSKSEFCSCLNDLFDVNEEIDELANKLDSLSAELDSRIEERDHLMDLLKSYFYHEK